MTSIGGDDFIDFGIQESLESHVMRLVSLAVDAGLRAVVCSAHEVGVIRGRYPDITLVVPGIRFNSGVDDQKRTKTPMDALSDGANYLVVGRPVTQSPDPLAAIDEILRSIGALILLRLRQCVHNVPGMLWLRPFWAFWPYG